MFLNHLKINPTKNLFVWINKTALRQKTGRMKWNKCFALFQDYRTFQSNERIKRFPHTSTHDETFILSHKHTVSNVE